MKAIILARVSSKEQQDGYSIQTQTDRLTEYCKIKVKSILPHVYYRGQIMFTVPLPLSVPYMNPLQLNATLPQTIARTFH